MKRILITLFLLIAVLVVLTQGAFAVEKPIVTIVLDKECIKVGETVTANYEIIGEGMYFDIETHWLIWTDEYDSQSMWDSVKLGKDKDVTSFSPRFGNELSCRLSFYDQNGQYYWYDSDKVQVCGDNTNIPSVQMKLEKPSINLGDTATVSYEIKGEGKYTDIVSSWVIWNNHGEGQDAGDSFRELDELSGSISYVPQFGSSLECLLVFYDENGRRYDFESEKIVIFGDEYPEPIVTIKIENDSIKLGEEVTATYKIENVAPQDNLVEYQWYVWANEHNNQDPLDAAGECNGTSGIMKYRPRFGIKTSCYIRFCDERGKWYWFESNTIPISGVAEGYDVYNVIEGQNTQISNGDSSLIFRANGEFEKYLDVQVDGKTVPSEYVKAWSGSTYVELSAEYLATLSEGEHELIIVFEDGVAVTKFATVKRMPELPQTGDSSNIVLYMMLMAVSVVCLAGMARKRRTE